MKSNILAFFFTIGSIVMAAFIVWFYNMSDKNPPEIRFAAMDMIYNAGTKEADLLNGVMAYDAVDGDITDRIVVEKTILNKEQSTAVVYYAVSDLSGNVAKQSRVFNADIDGLNGMESGVVTGNESIGAYPEGSFSEGFNTEGFNTEGFTQESIYSEEGESQEGGFQTGNAESAESGSSQESQQ